MLPLGSTWSVTTNKYMGSPSQLGWFYFNTTEKPVFCELLNLSFLFFFFQKKYLS